MIASLIQRYKAWRKRRYWASRHMEFLQNMIREDWRWLAANPVCDALTTRYKRAASTGWYELEHESSAVFRQRLGEIARSNEDATGQINKSVDAPRPDAPTSQINPGSAPREDGDV